nr:unnamed protein product [Callosobruchus analis]
MCLYFSTNEKARYSSPFEKLFALFGFSLLTWAHARVLFGKCPRNSYNAKWPNSKLQITANVRTVRTLGTDNDLFH